jgi:DNA-binding CsgD family transcriptional regulator
MLSQREQEILKLTSWDCLSAKEVADKLCISTLTVQQHIKNIKIKEHLSKVTELSKLYFTKYAREAGAMVLLLIFSITFVMPDEGNMRARRCRTGRRYETEVSFNGFEIE